MKLSTMAEKFEALYIEYMGSVNTPPSSLKLMQLMQDPRFAELMETHDKERDALVARILGRMP